MRAFRIALQALFLGMLNLFSILAGFGVYVLLKPAPQLAVQLPAAVFLTLVGFLLFSLLLPRFDWSSVLLRDGRDRFGVFLGSLLVTPLIFYPLHYLTQGYVARFDNVLAIWAFQVPVNALALFLNGKVAPRKEAAGDEL